MEPKWCQDGVKMAKKPKNNIDPIKKMDDFHSVTPFELKKWPSWSQLRFQNGAKMDKKIYPQINYFLTPLGICFWMSFGGFWMPTWSQVGTKWIQKSMLTWKGDFSKIVLWLQRGRAPEGTPSDGPMGYHSRLRLKKWSPSWNASWHRFLIDFGGFCVPSWEPSAIKKRSKKASKKQLKKECQQNG